MEDSDNKRGDEIVKMPTDLAEAREMLARIQGLLDNFNISSSNGSIAGNVDNGFTYNP